MNIKKLIELAEEGHLQCLDFEDENNPKEYDLLPLLKCAERMADYIREISENMCEWSKANVLIEKWDALNS